MADEEEIQNALLAIHSRLGTIEGKVTLVARAERDQILRVLRDLIGRDPLIGQIYLLLDGTRSQREIVEELGKYSITTSEPTVSRRMGAMADEHGITDLVRGGATKVYRKNRAMETVLNLTRKIRAWLEAGNHQIPEMRSRRPRKRKAT